MGQYYTFDSSTSAAIYALEADKVFVTLAEGTENALPNGGEYVAIDDNNIDAVIFTKTDLTLNGSSSLTINGGTLDLTCNDAGDTALDYDGTYTNNGGDVTTNDGSESNPGQMGGRGGMGGGKTGRG